MKPFTHIPRPARLLASLGVALFVLAGLDPHTFAQPPCLRWFEVTRAGGPGPRAGHAMAYDSDRAVTVLFGGSAGLSATGHESPLDNETWEYVDGIWSQLPGDTPTLRFGHALAYDSRRKKIVMLGGCCGALANDTDEYTAGAGWTSLLDGGLPPRYGHAMVYDTRRGVMVAYGGVPANTGLGAYDDTWELDVCTRPPDAVRWVDFAYTGLDELGTFTAPYNTLAEGIANVPMAGTLRVKTGTTAERPLLNKAKTSVWFPYGPDLGDMRHAPRPDTDPYYAVLLPTAAFDPRRGRVVRFGGLTARDRLARGFVYEWDGSHWERRNPPECRETINGVECDPVDPSPVQGALSVQASAMGFHPPSARLVMHGGLRQPYFYSPTKA